MSALQLDEKRLHFGGDTWGLETKLGSGRFASVYRLRCHTSTKQPLAAKVTLLGGLSPWARAQLSEELAIWQTLDHPNVVRLHGHLADATHHVLLLELQQGGELFERIVKMQSFCEAHAARQVGQVLSAVAYLHSFGVLHRDLKPENLLLESDADDAPVKVADFGASKLVVADSGQAKTPCGSLGYAAPEQLRGLKFAHPAAAVATYDKEVDLWSVGVITYILLSGTMPFDPSTYSPEALERQNALQFPPGLFSTISAEACAFIRALLEFDPTIRLSAVEALAHPWLAFTLPEQTASTSPADGAEASPRPPSSARSTPLSTPRRLKQLQDSGTLRKAWDRATEAGPLGRTKAARESDVLREIAHKRAAEEIAQSLENDQVTLMLPPEVTKRLRSGESSTLSNGSDEALSLQDRDSDPTSSLVCPPTTAG